MMSLARSIHVCAVAASCFAGARAQAPCFEWSERFSASGVDSLAGPYNTTNVVESVVFDDGSGPALYVCGYIDTAGSAAVSDIARWDGAQWAPFGGSLSAGDASGPVTALAVYDDGNGPALYAGGSFHVIGGVNVPHVAKWSGTTWQALGVGYGRNVQDLFVFDDGSGSKLYVSGYGGSAVVGSFLGALGTWDGANWALVGGVDPNGAVYALASYDDGSGPALYAGGNITSVGALPASHLIRWNGSVWSNVGGGVGNGWIRALAAHDDGSGPALYVGGQFTDAGGTPGFAHIARWNGAWSTVGGGTSGTIVRALASYDDGGSRQLYAGGDFGSAGGASCKAIARWNGASWSALGTPDGVTGGVLYGGVGQVHSLNVGNDGGGDALYVGGRFTLAGAVSASHIARWNAAGWSSLGTGAGLHQSAQAFASFDDGSGPELFLASDIAQPGASNFHRLARIDASNGSLTGSVPANGDVRALHEHDDGSGNALFAGGSFTNIGGVAASQIARWDGAQWSALGAGVSGGIDGVRALATFDDGGGEALWVAGGFASAGGAPAKRVARWDGSAWFAPALGPSNEVLALAVYDDGSGDALYAAGNFAKVGTQYMHSIAKWDGATWSALGQGLSSGEAQALAVFDDGSGEKLYVAGNFSAVPPIAAYRIARWDGLQWEAVGHGVGVASGNGLINSLAVFDDGTGPALIAGGYFVNSGATALSNLARWTGAQWVDFHGGTNHWIDKLYVFDDGAFGSPRLMVGGLFTRADDTVSLRIALLERSCPCMQTYCVAGTSVNGCVPAISASGTPSAAGGGGFVVSVDDIDGQRAGLLFYGLSGSTNSPWGATSSTLCVKPPQQRTGQSNSGGTGGACDGALTLDWDAYVASHPTSLGMPLQAGTSVSMQGWYRDPGNAKTTGLSDALEFLVCP